MRTTETIYTCDRCHTKSRTPIDWVHIDALHVSSASRSLDLCASCQRMTAAFMGMEPDAFSTGPEVPATFSLGGGIDAILDSFRNQRRQEPDQEPAQVLSLVKDYCQLPDCGCDGTPHEM